VRQAGRLIAITELGMANSRRTAQFGFHTRPPSVTVAKQTMAAIVQDAYLLDGRARGKIVVTIGA